jgi:hypothetical protein
MMKEMRLKFLAKYFKTPGFQMNPMVRATILVSWIVRKKIAR